MTPPPPSLPLTGSEHAAVKLRRNEMYRVIQSCTACERRTLAAPKPGTGPIPCQHMILTDTPSALSARDYLSSKLVNANLPPLRSWYVTSTVKCRNTDPDPHQIIACHGNIRAELAVVDPTWIVLLGTHALASTGVKAQITKCHGRPFRPPMGPFIGRWCFPTFHPAVTYMNEHYANLLTQDLSTLYGCLSGRTNLSSIEARVGRAGKLDLSVEA